MGEMVASLSHELAQPITATTNHAKASLRWLPRDPPDLTQVRKGTEQNHRGGHLCLGNHQPSAIVVQEGLSKTGVGRDECGHRRNGRAAEGRSQRACRFDSYRLAADLPKTMADRVQLQQVLMNLMMNGIEAMKDTGGVLTVKSQLCEDGQVEISVNDTGPGLPPGKRRPDIRRILYDEATRQRHGPGNLQVDRRITRRTDLGQRRRRAWRDVPLHLAGSHGNKPSRRCRVIRRSSDSDW